MIEFLYPNEKEIKEETIIEDIVDEEKEDGIYVPEDKDLLKLFKDPDNPKLPDKLKRFFVENNQAIDEVSRSGLDVIRYRRTCLKCDRTTIGYGVHMRSCHACKSTVHYNE